MAPHLLVTNDFPPKVGGIQTYLWELWRRLPARDVTVLTTPHPDAVAFDADQPYRIVRTSTRESVLLPSPSLHNRIERLADEVGAKLIVLDPALPVGLLGPSLARRGYRYAVVLHGSELAGRIPLGGPAAMGAVVKGSVHVIAAGDYPASEAERVGGADTPPITIIPPGVDTKRFRPESDQQTKAQTRRRFGLDDDLDAKLVVGISRLVPRKGFDVLIDAAARLRSEHPRVQVGIGGTGRDHGRLAKRITETNSPVRLLGRIPDDDLPKLYAAADVFAMCCRTRWAGLEPEGFGIVFLEAAACGVPQVAGDSGGAADAVVHGETGLVVAEPRRSDAVADAIGALLRDDTARAAMGKRARARAESDFTYEHLASRLAATLEALV